jgi:hypothetical protein
MTQTPIKLTVEHYLTITQQSHCEDGVTQTSEDDRLELPFNAGNIYTL